LQRPARVALGIEDRPDPLGTLHDCGPGCGIMLADTSGKDQRIEAAERGNQRS